MWNKNHFYDTYNQIFEKNNFKLDKNINLGLLDTPLMCIKSNIIRSVKRTITDENVLITWILNEDIQLVLNLLNIHYLEKDNLDEFEVIFKKEIIESFNEDLISKMLLNSDEKFVLINYKTTDFSKTLSINCESTKLFLLNFLNNDAERTRLVNLEFIRLNLLEFINTI